MKLRKANAILSLISTLLLLSHAIPLAAWVLSKGFFPKPPSFIPRALTIFFLLHAIISIILTVASYKDSKGHKAYPKLNPATLVQRITGVLVIVFTLLHIFLASGVLIASHEVHAVIHPVSFFLVLLHTAISASKAFITLGIGNAKFIKCSDIVIKVVCVVTLIADIIGFCI